MDTSSKPFFTVFTELVVMTIILFSVPLFDRFNWLNVIVSVGTNEDAIIKVLVTHDSRQRQEITAKFKTLYGKVNTRNWYRNNESKKYEITVYSDILLECISLLWHNLIGDFFSVICHPFLFKLSIKLEPWDNNGTCSIWLS